MLRLRGPFDGTLEQQKAKEGASTVGMLAEMFRLHGVDATVIGGTRSTDRHDPDTPWTMSRSTPSTPAPIVLNRRPRFGLHTRLTVRESTRCGRKGSNRTLGWPPGAERTEWPADVPIEDGSQFEIVTDGSARTTVTFRAMPSAVARALRGWLPEFCWDARSIR